ncbi:hypothetical protein B0T20DRAFT_450531 [Sordaria brevicollis]|uniref:Uncharacterized protein n=1 Tax=Sordaria brevicollis TaxID=83679 RepID=A0AAE0PKC1_SORBR|nr:hypothetical protein B0T20DRAFT_450531 [Sordaria brevicollis]
MNPGFQASSYVTAVQTEMNNDTAKFIHKQGPTYDLAFAVRSAFDQQRCQFVPRTNLADLHDALARYRELFPNSFVASAMGEDFWGDVTDHMHAAAQKSAEKRDAIFSAFEEIPGMIRGAEDNRSLFPRRREFQQTYDGFVQTLASAILNLMSLLLPKSETKKVLEKLPNPGEDVESILAPLKAALETLKASASRLKDEILVDTNGIVGQTAKGVNIIRSTLAETKINISDVSSRLVLIQENLDRQYQELKQQVSLQTSRSPQFYGIQAQNSLLIQLIETYELSELLTFLNASPLDLAKDLERSVSFSLTILSPPQQASARGILNLPSFQRWVRADVPDILCIESNPTDVHLSLLSTMAGAHPLSAFSANLIATLGGHRGAIILYFFPSLHADYNDPLSEPRALLANMITLLVLELRARNLLRLGFVNSRQYVHDLQYGNVACLCYTFGALLRQFPRDTPVYCVLDGISSYDRSDRPGWRGDVARILSTLLALVEDGELRPMLKVLVTCPFRWEVVERCLPDQKRAYTMANLLDGGGGVAGPGMSREFFAGMLDRTYEESSGVVSNRGRGAGDGYFRREDGGEMTEDDYN